MRCSPRLGGELLCAPKQLIHYHSPDELSCDEWRLSDKEVERIDLQRTHVTTSFLVRIWRERVLCLRAQRV